MYYTEEKEGVSIPDATPQDIMMAGADAFSRQIVQMMNEKLIAPYSLLVEKDKAQLEQYKKADAQMGNAAKCADAV